MAVAVNAKRVSTKSGKNQARAFVMTKPRSDINSTNRPKSSKIRPKSAKPQTNKQSYRLTEPDRPKWSLPEVTHLDEPSGNETSTQNTPRVIDIKLSSSVGRHNTTLERGQTELDQPSEDADMFSASLPGYEQE